MEAHGKFSLVNLGVAYYYLECTSFTRDRRCVFIIIYFALSPWMKGLNAWIVTCDHGHAKASTGLTDNLLHVPVNSESAIICKTLFDISCHFIIMRCVSCQR